MLLVLKILITFVVEIRLLVDFRGKSKAFFKPLQC